MMALTEIQVARYKALEERCLPKIAFMNWKWLVVVRKAGVYQDE